MHFSGIFLVFNKAQFHASACIEIQQSVRMHFQTFNGIIRSEAESIMLSNSMFEDMNIRTPLKK